MRCCAFVMEPPPPEPAGKSVLARMAFQSARLGHASFGGCAVVISIVTAKLLQPPLLQAGPWSKAYLEAMAEMEDRLKREHATAGTYAAYPEIFGSSQSAILHEEQDMCRSSLESSSIRAASSFCFNSSSRCVNSCTIAAGRILRDSLENKSTQTFGPKVIRR